MKYRFASKLPLLIGSLSLVAVLLFGTIFVLRAFQNQAASREPVFERIQSTQAAETDAEPTIEPIHTEARAAVTKPPVREPIYYFDEDVYLSRRLTDAAAAKRDAQPATDDAPEAAAAPADRATGRYLQTTVVAQFRQDKSEQAAVLRQLWAGEQVFEISTDDAWSNVRDSSGQEGYVAAYLLTAIETPKTTAAAAAPTSAPPALASPPAATAPQTVYQPVSRARFVRDGVVNVRQSDSAYSVKIAELPVGSRVTEVAVGPAWSKVQLTDGRFGYVLSALLSSDSGVTQAPPATTPPATAPPTPAPTNPPTQAAPTYAAVDKTQYVTATANVRASAGTGAAVLAQLPLGTAVRVTGVGTEWSRVSLNSGQTGYIYNTLLSDSKPVVATTPPTTPPTAAPTTPAPPAGSSLSFVQPGTAAAAVANFGKIAPYISPNGDKNYYSFTDNGNGTITVDGLTLPYSYVQSYGMTHYDGVAVSVAMGEYPVRNRSTATGIPAQRGLIAMKLPAYGGLPFGTVVFVEGYGLAVLADRGTLSSKTQVDLCYNGGESASVRTYGWAMQRMFVISIP